MRIAEGLDSELREAAMRGPDKPLNDDAVFQHPPEVIFSLADGFVWASRPDTTTPIKLGSYEGVKAMMQDFLDQSALGERLAKRSDEVCRPIGRIREDE